MKTDSRLSGVLHILLHMAEFDEPLTSEALAQMMCTNPVVVRRLLGALRKEGLVSSEKGHGGGWRLAKDLRKVSLYDVYRALEHPKIFAIGNRNETSGCLVERAVNHVMGESFEAAEALLLQRFKEVSLADMSAHVHEHWAEKPDCTKAGQSHQ
ncbi:Rrf2 family transcriptional regulator [Gilvimarinus algae]|uniref:Rrf2 family transcriptional regulator n=1 Tax=Gilvimarinus algae TaxID=3058037 RepID=A0ABT8TD27_9GAMM|nr:Rrf2 family transcriptional regulator [Gilvimarinus sp. SDUM040014]MDO3382027.1 Rrf2 family transcriptional regulator [Gilvimarinus sp. SDUM040014]